jgi:hypothetical protein
MLKRQLAAINNLDADLDQLEEKLESAGNDDKEDDFASELAGGAGGQTGAVAGTRTGAALVWARLAATAACWREVMWCGQAAATRRPTPCGSSAEHPR